MSFLVIVGTAIAIAVVCCAITSLLYERGLRKMAQQNKDRAARDPRAVEDEE